VHFIFSPIGSAGDVHPMLGIAVTLQNRGHEITFLTNGYFQETVERHGLRFVELGSKDQFLSVANHPDLWKPRRAFRYVFEKGVRPILRLQYAAIQEHSRSRKTIVVASCLGLGARIAQEKLGVPLVTAHLQPAVIPSRIAPPTIPGIVGPRWLKNKAAALVHHGGIGTTAQALAAGIPQLAMPLAHDQFDNATRVKRLGVGDWLMPSRFRGPVVAAELGALIGSEAVQRACRKTAGRISGTGGVAAAADAIEQFGGAKGLRED
jgi:UDP:flavonoid glycosyltransferase YjiC (YdhE family)